MLSAIWLLPIVLALSQGYADPQHGPLDVLYFALTAAFWMGHRVCSTYLAYATEAYRPLLRAQPVRFVVVPALVTIACFAVLLPPDAALPWDREERVVVLAIVDYVFVTYHFAAQHFGALSLYRLRIGRTSEAWTRRDDRWFALGIGGGLVFLADVLAGAVRYQDRWVDRWPAFERLVAAADDVRIVALVVVVAATAAMVLAERRAERPSLPRVLYVLGVGAMVVLALCSRRPFLFLVMWTAQHWIVATGLGSRTATAEPAPLRGRGRRMRHWVHARSWALVLLLGSFSVLLLPLFEVEASWDGGWYYGDWIFGTLASGLRTSVWVPALLALSFATGFVHYLLDRSVYRLSDPRVRRAAQGLLQAPAAWRQSSRAAGEIPRPIGLWSNRGRGERLLDATIARVRARR
jgi:hypothetical protein